MTVDGAADDGSTANSLSATFPLLAAEWHPTLNGNRVPASVTAGAKLKAFWLCGQRLGRRVHRHGHHHEHGYRRDQRLDAGLRVRREPDPHQRLVGHVDPERPERHRGEPVVQREPGRRGSVQIGFNASYTGTNTAPTAFTLNGTACAAG
jgi:Probable Zinc-ribbon domain